MSEMQKDGHAEGNVQLFGVCGFALPEVFRNVTDSTP